MLMLLCVHADVLPVHGPVLVLGCCIGHLVWMQPGVVHSAISGLCLVCKFNTSGRELQLVTNWSFEAAPDSEERAAGERDKLSDHTPNGTIIFFDHVATSICMHQCATLLVVFITRCGPSI